jgi:predicted metal-dependent phosphoesterase TrpH
MSENKRFDLHMHSTSSDGTVDPFDLADVALKAGMSGFSLTDHDTTHGLERARQGALAKGLIFVPGVEISASYAGKTVHILGYGFDVQSSSLDSFLTSQCDARNNRNKQLLEKLAQKGVVINESSLLARAKGSVGRVHIAQEIVKLGFAVSISEAFSLWIGDRAPCYIPSVSPGPDVCIRAIRKAGGKALLAHPHLMEPSHAKKTLKDFGWDGLEVFYGRFDRSRQMPWYEWAQKKKWVFSGGSDFHGDVKPESYIGSSWIDEVALKALLNETHLQSLGIL